MLITVRAASPGEGELIRAIHLDAFAGEDEAPAVAQLAVDLLTDETAEPRLVLVAEEVAEEEAEPLGCVLFTAVKLEGGPPLSVSILAPLAVKRSCHGQGVGRALVEHGLERLKSSGTDLVLVLGDPAYYSRFGFRSGHRIEAPYPLPYPEAWMALKLQPGALDSAAGVARCALSLSAPEHW
ncbi:MULTISPECIES: GNAT family N-acetyltransferase [Microbulbifer]|uniref:GNAT family N-acetyltransferase n=1 Tax=Microbulbifer TaxID=48073 RepID=UPI00074702F3|nr:MULTISPECIES: N-acetyltransferase [Microbulbifer]KUJ82649.1 hypothetical protein AVO43_12745 [Microbulbifer sp. ZGT114]